MIVVRPENEELLDWIGTMETNIPKQYDIKRNISKIELPKFGTDVVTRCVVALWSRTKIIIFKQTNSLSS